METSDPLVLVVDDERHMCNILFRILDKEGYQVITAPDGKTALRLVKEKKPDVILLDLIMPGIDGREVCRRVRKLSRATRIIYFTAQVGQMGISKEIRSEADAFIAKPATSRRILSIMGSVLKARH